MPAITYFFVFSIIGGLQNDLFAHDEKRCYHAFVTSTPLTEKGQVRAKYLGALILILILYALSYAVSALLYPKAVEGYEN